MIEKNKELTAQQKANKKQDEKRKSQKIFNQVRFNSENEDKFNTIIETIKLHGGTKEQALIDAFALLREELQSK